MSESKKDGRPDYGLEMNQNLPPDGGYGYVICIALCINFISCFSHMSSFGMQFHDFIRDTGTSTGSVTMVLAFSTTIMSFCGVLVNWLLKKYTSRQVALAGAVLYTSGWFLNYFITSIYQMFLTVGVLQGSGVSIITTVTYTCFNQYFDKKRVTVLSICQMIICVSQMIYPLFLEQLLVIYGFRGSILINTGFIGHTIFAAFCFQPVEWHYKKNHHLKNLPQELVPMKNVVEVTNLSKTTVVKSKPHTELEMQMEKDSEKLSLWRTVTEEMDLSLLSDIVYVNITIGIAISFAADIGFSLLYPLYLYSLQYTTSDVAFLLALASAADLVSRALMAFVGHFFHIPSRDIFFASALGGIVAKFCFLQFDHYWMVVTTAFFIGATRGPMQVTVAIVFAEYLPEKFAAAYGVAIFFMGNANTLVFPTAGYIRDWLDSYPIAFYFLLSIATAAMIPWAYEYWYFRKNRAFKKKDKKNVDKAKVSDKLLANGA